MKRYITVIGCLLFFTFSRAQQDEIQQEFLEWMEDGNLEEAKSYLEKGADINGKSTDGYHAGEYAIWNYDNSDELIIYLLDNGLDIHILNADNQNLLHIAADNEAAGIIGKLVDLGCAVNGLDDDGNTPLIIAGENEDLETIQALILKGADATVFNDDGKSIVNYLDFENEEHWNLLLSFGLSQKQKNLILYECVYELEDVEKLKEVIALGGDVNFKDEDGTPMFWYAAELESTEFVEVFLSHGVDVNATDEDGYSALWAYENTDMLKLLLKSGVNPNLITEDESPLFEAIYRADVDGVNVLLAAGADPKLLVDERNALDYCKELLKLENAPGPQFENPEDEEAHTKRWKARLKEISKVLK